jgi:predicted acyl esterase
MKRGLMKYLLLLCVLVPSFVSANICVQLNNQETPDYSFNDELIIKARDGIEIHGNIFTPKNFTPPLPTVIFVNSWTQEEHEYINQAKLLAKKGYQVLSYSTRGFGCSGGKTDMVGPMDMSDLGLVIDWLEMNTQVDMNNIGMSGISYGAGMSLMALAKEPRIKTVAAMSGWGSMLDAIYHQNTPRLFWSTARLLSGWLTGEVDNANLNLLKNLILPKDTAEAIAWAKSRSPITWINRINALNKPVYLSNNFGDNLFQPNNILNFFNKLDVPKILDLNQGTHATGELSGLFTVNNYTYKRMHDWFDYWLKGDQSIELNLNEITMQTDLKHKRIKVSAQEFYSPKEVKLNLSSRNFLRNGGLNSLKTNQRKDKDILYTGFDTRATTGVPILSSILDGHFKLPVYNRLPMIQRLNGIYYKSSVFVDGLSLSGIPKLQLVTSSSEKNYQLVAYLYDVNKFGFAKLITHGVATKLTKRSNTLDEFNLELVATAYDLPKGHSIVLAIDTEDILYARPLHYIPYRIEIHFGSQKLNQLVLPVQ